MIPFRQSIVLSLFLCLLPATSFPQNFTYSFGARAGLLTNPRYSNNASTSSNQSINVSAGESQRPVFGPTFELGFKNHFAIEFSPTYRRDGSIYYTNQPFPQIPELPPNAVVLLSQFNRQTSSAWDLPILGKYYFGRKEARIRPFLGVGVNTTRRSSTADYYSQTGTGEGVRGVNSGHLQNVNWGVGPVAGAGLTIRSGRFSIVPEFRYLRDSRFSYPGVRDRAEIFLGFRF